MKFEFTYNEIILITALLSTLVFIPVEIAISFLYLILLPGFIISNFLFGKTERHKLIIFSVGVGVAFIPLITFLYKMFFISLNFFTINLTVLFLLFLFVFKNLKKMRKIRFSFKKSYDLYIIILVIILFLGLFSRVYPVKDMNAPLFADPAVEGTIARLIIDNQGIPETWEPFLDLKLAHQTGFASIVAWFNIISGFSIPRVILFLTNMLHGLFPLTIYMLASPLFKDRLRPLVAGLIALVSAFPTFIFVAGMNSGVVMYFLLPFLLFLVFRNFSKPSWKEMSLLTIVSLGCFLVHPIYLFFLLLFSFPFILVNMKPDKKFFKKVFILFLFAVLVPCMIFLPKILNTFNPDSSVSGLAAEQWEIQRGYTNPKRTFYPMMLIDPIFVNFNNRYGFWYIYVESIFYMQIVNFIPAMFLSTMFLFSIYIIFKEKNKTGWTAISWYILLFIFGTLQSILAIKFPGWQYIYPTRVKFLTMIPLSVILSFGLMRVSKFDFKHWKKIWKIIPFLILIIYLPFGLGYMQNHLSELSQRKGLSDTDLESIEWIKENTDEGSVILNTIGDIEAGAFIGGPGQWIPVLANRKVMFPATSLTEDISPLQKRTGLMDCMERGEVSNPEFLELLKSYEVSHIFISEKLFHSRKNFPKIDCDIFYNSSYYELKFKKNGNCIFYVSYPSSI